MMSKSEIVVIDSQHEHVLFTLEEVCERCGTHTQMIVEMVEYGIVEPIEQPLLDDWYFNSQALVRLQRAQRLMNGLKLNLSGVALSLELLDEIDGLQQHIEVLRRQLP
ncbi:chaperone modulator CbpM [Marinomonas primoryensis]|jgi:chaperone modulatory protein CbpM|uniref:Chaperone modulator CbpM n=1 Tax=Marinomonas primoryensis TaxID=178399 RepID=A0ABV0L1X6_9GAMM|tara:strand:+ start:6659 stop:6982 length:324 start_codon:yes stop_codon:yes gene_type:complete